MKIDFTDGRVPEGLAFGDALREATREELAVLLFCLAARGVPEVSVIAKAIGTGEARVKASLSYWDAVDLPDGNIREEFPARLRPGEIRAEGAGEVARAIRDNDLASLMESCAHLLGKPTLNGKDAENIAALYTQYGLSEEYIFTLLSDIVNRSESGHPSVSRLVKTADRLMDEGVDTVDALNEHFRRRDELGEWERSVRRILGIYDRALSQKERECFARWTDVYGYSKEILAKAYDITVANTGRASTPYMDKLLTAWNAAGVRTLSDCERYDAEHREKSSAASQGKKPKKEKERFGTFDPEEAFRHALERSYGTEKETDKAAVRQDTPEKSGK